MKKFNVECSHKNQNQINGTEAWDFSQYNYVGDYIEAETAEEATEYAMDTMVEQAAQNGFTAEIEDGAMKVTNVDGEVVEEFFNFSAKEI